MTFVKDPAATVDYEMDWAAYLEGSTITSSSWSVSPGGMTITNQSNTPTLTTVWLAGGTVGERYTARNLITTSTGQTDSRGITITIAYR
jgi:hypothetical protein